MPTETNGNEPISPQGQGCGIDQNSPLLTRASVSDYQSVNHDESHVENDTVEQSDGKSTRAVMGIIGILLIGVFVCQADTSLVIATYPQIGSEFHDLERGPWLLSIYMLSTSVVQPLYGKLSDIFGRKRCLQVAYILFGLGTLGCGLGMSMNQILTARVIQGAGGAGMVCVLAILLTDLVPMHEVATYRSYVNIAQTLGRSCGGAIGGVLAQSVGWRWAFLGQVPPVMLTFILIWCSTTLKHDDEQDEHKGLWVKLKRIDFLGALFMAVGIATTILFFSLGGQSYSFNHPLVITIALAAFISIIAFCIVESYWAREPIFPLHLLRRYSIAASYVSLILFNIAQTGLMNFIPIYFLVLKNATSAVAGAYLVPSIVGNAVGGLLTGWWIRRTGLYKFPITIAATSSISTFSLLLLLWHGNTNFWEHMVVLFGGFATGIAHSAIFIGITSNVENTDIAVASSGFYLSNNLGGVMGICASSSIFQVSLQHALAKALKGYENAEKIMEAALSDINFVRQSSGGLRRRLLPAYVTGIHNVFTLCLCCAICAFCISLSLKQKTLRR